MVESDKRKLYLVDVQSSDAELSVKAYCGGKSVYDVLKNYLDQNKGKLRQCDDSQLTISVNHITKDDFKKRIRSGSL